ncbi:uncharacterized protein LOC122293702 [Carya illinoinensis]|uniref:uncharacterized protein LOC122293702 n=1 Tax=Carya illinoinensis TaxID=32201 RepID=UPI001C728460|nr:uncharacterized protein LOC122293702 [Carya illinoinensis]
MAGPEREDDYAALLEAHVRKGDWGATIDFLKLQYPRALTARIPSTFSGGTVLHAAVDAEDEHRVEELVNMISEHDLATMQDDFGYTADLQEISVIGNYRMAKCLITKNKSLVSIRDYAYNELPVTRAMGWGA